MKLAIHRRGLGCAAAFLAFLASPAVAAERGLLDQVVAARQAYEEGQWDKARGLYAQLAEQLPDDADVRFRLGNIDARLGRLDEAAATYRVVLERQPAFPRAWHNLALVRLQQAMDALADAGRHADAEERASSQRLLDALDTTIRGAKPAVPDCPAAETPAARAFVAFAAARVNLRDGCGTGHAQIAAVAADSRLDVLAREGACARVRTEAGKTGWLPQSLLRLAPMPDGKHEP